MRKSTKSDLHRARYIVSTQHMLANNIISHSMVSVDDILLYNSDVSMER